ncbi:TPA: DUF4238 domain-containing protein [Vibrio vulnificus]|nr:DUF4238 domain-containing protein [Vibrio vulnificus]HDY7498390.1 DUF4238 domain-containing protein [Vibrio vulnificus]
MSSIIVKNQHILPARSIKRFCNSNGDVKVLLKESGKVFLAKTTNKIFCVQRFWDQSAEKGVGKRIEDDFQAIVDKVLFHNNYKLHSEYQTAITRFYALWKYRSLMDNEERVTPEQSKLTPLVTDSHEKQLLDEMQIHYVDENGSFPSRNTRGFELQGQVMMFERMNNGLVWHLVASPHLDLIVPDTPHNDLYIPISPTRCLLAGTPVESLSLAQSIHANTSSYMKSKKYVLGTTVEKYA